MGLWKSGAVVAIAAVCTKEMRLGLGMLYENKKKEGHSFFWDFQFSLKLYGVQAKNMGCRKRGPYKAWELGPHTACSVIIK